MNTTKNNLRTTLKNELELYLSDNYDIAKTSKLWAVDVEYSDYIQDIVEALMDYHLQDDDLSDVIHELADDMVGVCCYQRADWFVENTNWQYVDEAINEFGHSDNIMADIAQGQYIFYTNAINAILGAVQ